MNKNHHRTEILKGAPLHYAPQNELGVVFLFAYLAKKWRLRIEEIQASFPDCVAYQKTQSGEKRIRIEFEYKSRNFQNHKHSVKNCDWIVCWEHNWPDAPKKLHIIELRREFGLGFNVWFVPVNPRYSETLAEIRTNTWSVPSQAHKDDLILFYTTLPDKQIRFIFRLKERADKVKAGWKDGDDYQATVNKICELKSPIFLEDLKNNRILSTASFARSQRNRYNATEYWPYLYEMIIGRNPSLRKKLSTYAPERLT